MEELNDCPICDTEKMVAQVNMGGVTTWICQACGYQTNEGLVKDSDIEKSVYESQPELFKDLRETDDNNFVWYPSVLNEKNKAMIFPDGTTVENWGYRVAKYIPVESDDKVMVGQTHKLDMKNSTLFPPQLFGAALYLYSTFLREEN